MPTLARLQKCIFNQNSSLWRFQDFPELQFLSGEKDRQGIKEWRVYLTPAPRGKVLSDQAPTRALIGAATSRAPPHKRAPIAWRVLGPSTSLRAQRTSSTLRLREPGTQFEERYATFAWHGSPRRSRLGSGKQVRPRVCSIGATENVMISQSRDERMTSSFSL